MFHIPAHKNIAHPGATVAVFPPVPDDALWWSESMGRIELTMTLEQAQSCSHSGRCDDDVAALRQCPEIRAQLDALDREKVRAALSEYGAWDDDELADHDANLTRLLWVAACDLAEEAATTPRVS